MVGLELPETQTTVAERALLPVHLPGRKRGVEVGVYEGFTTRLLADVSEDDAEVYGVDPFFPGRLGICWGLLNAKTYNHKHLSNGNLQLVRTLSTKVGSSVPPTVDFVFIDADHSLEGITADRAFWSERIEPGGIIALHDTLLMPDRPSSAEFWSHQYFCMHIQHDRRFEILGQQDSLSLLRKL